MLKTTTAASPTPPAIHFLSTPPSLPSSPKWPKIRRRNGDRVRRDGRAGVRVGAVEREDGVVVGEVEMVDGVGVEEILARGIEAIDVRLTLLESPQKVSN